MSFLCKIGIHKWNHTRAIYSNNFGDGGLPITPAKRVCECGKKQYLDVHCLGMNPPEFVRTWRNK